MRSIWRRTLDGISPYEAGKPIETLVAELGLDELVRLSANESPLGPSPHVVDTLRREAARVHLYPDGGSSALREALARTLGVSPAQLVIGNGADEVITLIAQAALDAGDEVVVPHPSFEPYATAAAIAGARVVASPLAGYETDLADMARRVTAHTKIVFVCSPHNPAGTIVRRQALIAWLRTLGDDPPLVVLDEAYHDFADDPEYPDGVALLATHPRLVVLRTFSKIAGLAGLRVGYAVAAPDTIGQLNRVRAPYNVNRLGQVAAIAALEDSDHLARTRRLVIEERAFLVARLAQQGLVAAPSQANFVLVRVPDADRARQRLLGAGLLVRDGSGVGFPGHLRVSIGTRAVNERLLKLLAD